jgi:PIF1 helicase.
LQPLEKFCDGQSIAADQIYSLVRVHDGTQKNLWKHLDHTYDLRKNKNRFGSEMILLVGDFRLTLPVIPRSTPPDELNSCLKSSVLWKDVKTLKLNMNMRVELQNEQSG